MLDDILARSNLRLAFEGVRENHGCHGADGMTAGQFAADLERELDRLQDRLLRRVASFDQGFKFLGALFVHEDVYLPFLRHHEPAPPPVIPPALDLSTYLELKHAG